MALSLHDFVAMAYDSKIPTGSKPGQDPVSPQTDDWDRYARPVNRANPKDRKEDPSTGYSEGGHQLLLLSHQEELPAHYGRLGQILKAKDLLLLKLLNWKAWENRHEIQGCEKAGGNSCN